VLVDFYHLRTAPVERVLPSIAEKVLAAGGRLLIVASEQSLGEIDRALWTYSADSFLPHGIDNAEAQPVLLSAEPVATNGATHLALADGRFQAEALGFERVFYFFDAERLEEARANWRALQGRDETETRYWKQDESGRWVQGP
jgi:DNA polymerase-3 subunit chi